MNLRNQKFRPQVFRAFQRWHAKNKKRFPCRLILTDTTATALRFVLDGIHPALSLFLRKRGFDVVVTWQGCCWDMLISYDCIAIRSGQHYYCGLCTNLESLTMFDSIDAFWDEHLFTPLADWLETELMPAQFLYLVGSPHHLTWATLHSQRGVDFEEPRDICLPVHLHTNNLSDPDQL